MNSKFSVLLLALAASAITAVTQDKSFYLKDGDHVVFYGHSITDQRLYTTFMETFVVTRFPKLHVQFMHSGWGGDRVTGGGGGAIDVRLPRDVYAYKPTVMTIMLGMNKSDWVQRATQSLMAALDDEEEDGVKQQRAAAQPTEHRFELAPQP